MAPNVNNHKMAVNACKLKKKKATRGSVKTRRRKRRRSACATTGEGSMESDSPEPPRSALSKTPLFPTAPEEEDEAVISIADSPPVHNTPYESGFACETPNTTPGLEPMSAAVPQREEEDCCNGVSVVLQ